MASTKSMQEEAMSTIDTAKAIIDKVMSIMELITVSPSLSISFSTNPIGFLMYILEHLGVSYEQVRQWLVNFLIYVVPVLEVGVKTILLTNLKNMISCSVDPRIPEKYRKQHKSIDGDWNTSQENGIDINIESIDFLDKLSTSPLSDFGSEMYFGLEGIEDSYKFARADDFDAFLWFVIHKGKFPSSTLSNSLSKLKEDIGAKSVTPEDGSMLGEFKLEFDSGSTSGVLLGNTFAYENGHVISMCIDKKYDSENNGIENTIVPVSDDWTSVNWYTRKGYAFTNNLGIDKIFKGVGVSRDYSKERALCNLQYIDQASSDSPLTGLVNNKLRFTILPRPYIHIPVLYCGEAAWNFKKMLFDCNGNYDPKGKYTFSSEPKEEIREVEIGEIRKKDGTVKKLYDYYIDFKISGETVGDIYIKTGKFTVRNREFLIKNLVECYPGLTVFEFNYDYVMSLKLFDAKVMATTLLDSLIDMQVGVNIKASRLREEAKEKIRDILKEVIESDDSEINDCVFSFDNSKYDNLLRKSEEKRAKREKFGNSSSNTGTFESVKAIFDEYDTATSLDEQSEILHRAIRQAAEEISYGADEEDRYNIEFSFVFDLIENLVLAIVEGILSPKVLLLLEVNQTIMGGTWEKFTLEDLLRAMRTIITAIIKEVRDLIIQELLKFVLKLLDPIVAMLLAILVKEQLDNYSDAIMDIIKNCPLIWFKFGNKDLDTKLDTVDYADIDVSGNKDGGEPSTNNC